MQDISKKIIKERNGDYNNEGHNNDEDTNVTRYRQKK